MAELTFIVLVVGYLLARNGSEFWFRLCFGMSLIYCTDDEQILVKNDEIQLETG